MTFDYETISPDGSRAKGKIEAKSQAAAAATLEQQGLTPLKIAEAGTGMQKEIAIPGLGGRIKTRDLAVLARQFATMTSSGMSLIRSLAILEEQNEKPKLREALRDVRTDVEGGAQLSSALAKHDRIFPQLMVAMIRAGETGGFLDGALDGIATTLEKEAALKGKVKSALTYPVIVLAFSLIMIVGVIVFIVPVFEKMFKSLGGQLPLPTRILVVTSHQMWWAFPLVAGTTIAGTMLFRRELRNKPSVRLAFDAFKLRLPVFGKLLQKIAISRFTRNLGTLLSVGVPVIQALEVVGDTTGNSVITEATKDIQQAVRDGQPMTTPLRKHAIFPAMVTQMIEVGEQTGQISTMLDKVADFYDQEVEDATEALTASIEPIMVVFMGVIVGSMVICLYLPMFTIYQHVQGTS
ncbi:type II secretion system F family protein [Jatrophihabitans sp. GAS493]|uniref:type II secretion system F family protein n=1 Tax=Jatrophihabitans sp. GAS493 TaxID=1907575 RepID=UPI0018D55E58|nr:type II secretion system F family protein [Jatrophihabitans sp. GAS493]